jgi:hypothetical protein
MVKAKPAELVAAKPAAAKAVAKIEKRKIVSTENLEKLKAMREQSGEGQKMSWPFVPVVQVDNHRDDEIVKGKKAQVLCDPNFVITNKDKDNNYADTILGPEFRGSILLIRYIVEKKWQENDSTPFFRSFEFDEAAFRNKEIKIVITQNKEKIFKGSYAEFKSEFDDRYVLSAMLYTLEENTDRIVRFKFKGVNRGAFWEYKDLFGSEDSISAHVTKFTLATVADGGKNYNHIVLEDEGLTESLDTVMIAQAGLVDYFKKLNKEDQPAEGEVIKVDKMPFEPSVEDVDLNK